MTEVKYVAHRGLSAEAPENTLPAFALACQSGFWGIECNIYCTADDQWFVFHDSIVDRVTNGTGRTIDYTYERIRGLTIDAGHGIDQYPGLIIPTLGDVLAVCKEYSKFALIEIKDYLRDDQLRRLVRQIEQSGIWELCRLICFNSDTLRKLREISKDIPLGYLSVKRPSAADIRLAEQLAPAFLDYYFVETDSADIRKCHAAGIEVALWTIDTHDEAERFIRAGADYITTNRKLFDV